MKELIKRNLSAKKVLILFVLTNIVYVFMLTVTIPAIMSYSHGIKILDMMPMGYDADYVNTLLNTLGEEGRQTYLVKQIPIDLIYPFLFGVSYCLVIAYFLNKIGKLESLFYLCLLPVVAGFFDYLENVGIIALLNTYPDISARLIQVTSVFSIAKSTITTIYFILLIVVLIMFGINKMRSVK
ncbi:MAG: hypothetical protein ABL895_16330 [Cyclobacteriaceae bacterium]